MEDWGCGGGWAGRFIDGPYRGIDGAWAPWADVQADLRTYRSAVPCALMRHVLEHNLDWRDIAANFSDSWHDRAALVLFIPPQPEDMDVGHGWDGGDWPVPDLAVAGPDLIDILSRHGTRFEWWERDYSREESTIQWGWEGALLMSR